MNRAQGVRYVMTNVDARRCDWCQVVALEGDLNGWRVLGVPDSVAGLERELIQDGFARMDTCPRCLIRVGQALAAALATARDPSHPTHYTPLAEEERRVA